VKGSTLPARARREQLILLAVLIGLGLLCSRGLLRAYSYWHDELFSIGAANATSWRSLFEDWILPDTHPPLHLVLLKAWVSLFGSGEIPSRLLSLIPAWLSLGAMAWSTRDGGFTRQLIAVLFLGTSPLFSLYSQEVRPYAWALLFATTSVGTMTLLWRSRIKTTSASAPTTRWLRLGFALSLLLLSLTHYFGLLYALTLVAFDLLAGSPCLGGRHRGVALMASLFIWPLVHGLFGGGAGRTEWIESQPVIGVIKAAANGVFPAFTAALALALIATLIVVLAERKRAESGAEPLGRNRAIDPHFKEAMGLLTGMASFMGLICAIDLIKPLAVERYFIVLLPPLALALADGGQWLIQSGSVQTRRATLLVLIVIIGMHLWHSQEVLAAKIYPQENYRELANFLQSQHLCNQGCTSTSAKKSRLKPYFDSIPLIRFDPEKDGGFEKSRLPFIGLHGEQKLVRPLLKAHPGATCWEPSQYSRSSTFVVLQNDPKRQPQLFGLQKCSKP
jgi:mannosyltransferase